VIGPIRPAQPQDFEAIEAIENEADRLFVERFGSVPWEAAPGGGSQVSAPGFVLVATGGSSRWPPGCNKHLTGYRIAGNPGEWTRSAEAHRS